MKYYEPQNHKQLSLDLFRSSLEDLDKSNRWVVIGDLLPWAEIEKVYNSRLNNEEKGAGNKPARMVIGAMIIKHKLNLGDEETIEIIRENPYMQYLCGLSEFTDKPIFDPSLFVHIRKRISEVELNEMSTKMLLEQKRLLEEKRKREEQDADDNGTEPPATIAENEDAAEFIDSEGRKHQGILKIDATCADAEMRYPVDVDIIHDGCRKIYEYITKICDVFDLHMPRTHYKDAHRAYLTLIKRAKKRGQMVHGTIACMLNYLYKDIRTMMDLMAPDYRRYDFFYGYEKRTISAIFTMYHQQNEMFRTGIHHCSDRILSIFQPHVRAIVRGKAKAKTEFGAKIGASIVDGYTFIDHHSWQAYNESADMDPQIQLYQERFGHLPSTVLADKIYMNKVNRDLLAAYGIKTYCKPLGRPPKEPISEERRAKMAKAVGERNEIECSFGTGKRIYRANDIRAKLPETARCWTGMCYFVKNVMKFLRELCLALTEIWQYILIIFTTRRNVYPPAKVRII